MAEPMIPRGEARASTKALFIDYCPKDMLDDCNALDAIEELAYRRLIDLVVTTGDDIPDDDKRLAWMTKTGRRWKLVKAALISAGKIEVSEGKIRVAKAADMVRKSVQRIEQKSAAGRASAERRKSLESNETTSTAVATDGATEGATGSQLPKNPRTHKEKKLKKEPAWQGGRGNYVGSLPIASDVDRSTWDMLVKGYSADKPWSWPVFRGPKPDEPGCYAPAEVLAAHGFQIIPARSIREARHG